MLSVFRFHAISESDHRILNPLSAEQLALIGEICGLQEGQTHLDLASGKGEMLCQFAARHGTSGLGVDIDAGWMEAARERARDLGVDDRVRFVHDNASTYAADPDAFDVVSCIGATWIGGGLAGTLRLMRPPLRPRGWVLAGEPFWIEEPPAAAKASIGVGDEITDLSGVLACFEETGFELVEMVLANHDTWDRYAASQWLNVARWLDANPDDPEADDIRRTRDDSRRSYLQYGRRYFGWGVFIGRPS